MPCLITALTRSAIKKATKKQQENKQKQKFHCKNSIYFVFPKKHNRWDFSLMRLGNKST